MRVQLRFFLFFLLFWACSDGDSDPVAEDLPPEQSQAQGIEIEESALSARLGAEQTFIKIPIKKRLEGLLEGRAKVELIGIAEAEVVAAGNVAFSIEGRTGEVEVPVDFIAPEDWSELGGYVIRYRVEGGPESLWGRRSLFTAAARVELQLLGPDTLRTNTTTHLRLIAQDPGTGEALTELPVSLHLLQDEEEILLAETLTDRFGNADLALSPGDELAGAGELLLRVETAAGQQRISAPVVLERATRILLTTDKPIYQPGQIIHLRALALRRPELQADADQDITFEISDAKDNKLERFSLRTDEFGVASAQFQIAREVNMGSWRIAALMAGAETEKNVTVDRYSLPKYDLDLELDRQVYLAGSTLMGTVHARYFFGQAVEGQIRVEGATHDVARTLFAEVQGETNEEGLFQFEMQLPPYMVGLPLEQGGGLVELSVHATDSAGQERSLSRTLRIASAAIETVVVPESGELVLGLLNQLLIRCTDAAGRPLAASHSLTLNGEALEGFETDESGLASVSVQVSEPELRGRIISVDGQGNEVEQELNLRAGPGQSEGAVLLRTDRALYKIGEEIEIEVETIGAPDLIFLDVIKGGQTLLTKVLEAEEGIARDLLNLSSDHSGALQLDAYYLALGSSLRRDSKLIYVEPADGLRVEVSADRSEYRPAEEAELTFQIRDADGNGHVAALGVQIVDEAVFSLMEFRAGLERLYFQIEAELAAPRYQIGVPGLNSIASQPSPSEDPVTQDEARLLFAATEPSSLPGISINTYRRTQEGLLAVIRPFVSAIAEEFLNSLSEGFEAGWLTEENLLVVVEQEVRSLYDPWGKSLQARVEHNQLILLSAGPDERFETADDVELRYDTWQLRYRNRNPGQGVDFDEDGDGDFFDNAEAGAGGAGGAAPPSPEDPSAANEHGDSGAERPRVRRYFPETLLVEPSLISGPDGVAKLSVPLADSITTWRVTSLVNSVDGLLGSSESGIRVFQDFFVDIDFPATLTRGDMFSAPVAIYNYLDEPQTVRLEVQEAEWFSLEGPAVIELELEPGEVQGARIPLQVEKVGLHELTIFAMGSSLQDAVARKVLVEPDGQKVEEVVSGRLEGEVSKLVQIPAGAVEGSGKLLIKLYPGLFSSVVEGLDGILRMPSGCFEQTSSSTWPNVLVARYMADTDSGTPETLLQAHEYINTGYQRLLTFEVNGGGFEWFGNDPPHEVLTAYGLLEFSDMAEVRLVDAQMLARTRAWLLGQQQGDGHWQASRGLDETGNLTDPVTITAYVAFALAAAGEQGAALDRARSYLESNLGEMGTYSLALFANFMVAYAPNDPLTRRLLTDLGRQVQESIQGQEGLIPAHWETDEQTTTYGSGEPAWIETTALATHALLVAGAEPGITTAALDWLISRKSGHGGWGSTAGTVWTIKCLLAALRAGQDSEANGSIRVLLDGVEQAQFELSPETSDIMRQADLSEQLTPGQPQEVQILMEGEGNLHYGVLSIHHQPWEEAPPAEGPLSIEVSYDRTHLAVDDMVTVQVDVSNNDISYADMVMVDLGIPPGFELLRSDADLLVEQGIISRYEATERQLLLYFTAIAPDEPVHFEYRIIARHPIRAQAPRSRIYSYYNPDVGSSAEPVDIEVD